MMLQRSLFEDFDKAAEAGVGVSTGSVRSITEQTGWKRPFSMMICQEQDVLLKIREYSYDLEDMDFVKYYQSRTGCMITLEEILLDGTQIPRTPESWAEMKRALAHSNEYENWLMESEDYRFEKTGEVVPFEGNDRRAAVKVFRIQKGRLQDCWELYQKERLS